MPVTSSSSIPTTDTSSSNINEEGGIFSGIMSRAKQAVGLTPSPVKSPLTQKLDAENKTRVEAKTQAEAQTKGIRSLSDLGHHNYSSKDSTFTQAYQSGQVNQQPTRELKAAALKGYLNKVYFSPQFQSLDREKQDFVSRALYRKWVQPSLKDQGINPPTYEEWAEGKPTAALVEKPSASISGTFGAGLAKGLGEDAKFIANGIHRLMGTGETQDDLVTKYQTPQQRVTEKENRRSADRLASVFQRAANGLDQVNTHYQATFKPLDSKSGWAANMAGQGLGYVPMYIAMEATGGAALEGAGLEIGGEAATKIPKLTDIITTLAERAGIGGKAYKAGVTALVDSSEFYLADKGEGKTQREALTDATSAAILGPALHGVFHGLGAGREALAKKLIKLGADKAAVGGEGLINALDEAASQGEKIEAGELNKVTIPPSTKDRVYSLVNDDDPDFIKLAQNEYKTREHVASQIHPDVAERYLGKVWNNISKTKRAKIIAYMSETQRTGTEYMALANPEAQTAKNAQIIMKNSEQNPRIAARLKELKDKYGVDAATAQTKAQAGAQGYKQGLVGPAATLKESFGNEFALPKDLEKSSPRYRDKQLDFEDPRDKALYVVARDFKKSESDNPNSAAHEKFLDYLQKHFPDKTRAQLQVTEGREVRARVKELAHGSEEATVRIPRSEFLSADTEREKAEEKGFSDNPEEEYEPKEGDFASYGPPKDILYARMHSGANILRPRTVEQLTDAKTGSEDFIYGTRRYLPNTPKGSVTDKIHFENPEHQLLYLSTLGGTQAKDKISNKAFYLLRKEFKEKKSIAQVRAGWLEHHIDLLQQSGHENEGRVFRSTPLKTFAEGSKTSRKLIPEMRKAQIAAIPQGVRKNSPDVAAALEKTYARLATANKKATTPKTAKLASKLSRILKENLED